MIFLCFLNLRIHLYYEILKYKNKNFIAEKIYLNKI
jgi:hypothetical protein